MASARDALILAVDEYEDAKLCKLRAPAHDAEALQRVLGDPDIGAFSVELCANQPEHLVRRKVARFFAERRRDDLLLLHISCHGLKDDAGQLFFAASDTEVGNLEATGLAAEFVNRQMTNSRSRRIVLLLDCCYSGAFARGLGPRGDERIDVRERFEGTGRAVLTASKAMEYAFEGEELSGTGQPSVFTSAIVNGLKTGEADRDRDGRISVDELYDYVYDRVREVTPKQTPGKWIFDVQGELVVAKARSGAAVEANTTYQPPAGKPLAERDRAGTDAPSPTAPPGTTGPTDRHHIRFRERPRRQLALMLAVPIVLALGAVAAVIATSGHERSGSSPSATTSGGGGTVTEFGEIGNLAFGASTAEDVAAAAGRPERIGQGKFELPGVPPYRALGYGCSASSGSDRRSLDYQGGAPYCRTVYYINAKTKTLQALWTTSPSFRTGQGTRPGIPTAQAEQNEGQQARTGCTAGITLRNSDPMSSTLIIGTGSGNSVRGGKVDFISDESNRDQVGLQFC